MGAAAHLTIREDQLGGSCKLFRRDAGKTRAHLLVGRVVYAVTGEAFPVIHPGAAEGTLTIENQQRAIEGVFGHGTSGLSCASAYDKNNAQSNHNPERC